MTEGVTLIEETVDGDDPGKALVAHAAEHGFDLLVVGRRGAGSDVHPGLGRSADHAVRHAHCPVLVVGS